MLNSTLPTTCYTGTGKASCAWSVHGLCRSKSSLLPLTSFLELTVSLPLTSTCRLFCRRIRISLACSTGSVSPGRVCLLYAGPCTLHQRDHCQTWNHPSLCSSIPSLIPVSPRVSPPVIILPSYGGKLICPSKRDGMEGKSQRRKMGLQNLLLYAKLPK